MPAGRKPRRQSNLYTRARHGQGGRRGGGKGDERRAEAAATAAMAMEARTAAKMAAATAASFGVGVGVNPPLRQSRWRLRPWGRGGGGERQ